MTITTRFVRMPPPPPHRRRPATVTETVRRVRCCTIAHAARLIRPVSSENSRTFRAVPRKRAIRGSRLALTRRMAAMSRSSRILIPVSRRRGVAGRGDADACRTARRCTGVFRRRQQRNPCRPGANQGCPECRDRVLSRSRSTGPDGARDGPVQPRPRRVGCAGRQGRSADAIPGTTSRLHANRVDAAVERHAAARIGARLPAEGPRSTERFRRASERLPLSRSAETRTYLVNVRHVLELAEENRRT